MRRADTVAAARACTTPPASTASVTAAWVTATVRTASGGPSAGAGASAGFEEQAAPVATATVSRERTVVRFMMGVIAFQGLGSEWRRPR